MKIRLLMFCVCGMLATHVHAQKAPYVVSCVPSFFTSCPDVAEDKPKRESAKRKVAAVPMRKHETKPLDHRPMPVLKSGPAIVVRPEVSQRTSLAPVTPGAIRSSNATFDYLPTTEAVSAGIQVEDCAYAHDQDSEESKRSSKGYVKDCLVVLNTETSLKIEKFKRSCATLHECIATMVVQHWCSYRNKEYALDPNKQPACKP